MKKSEEQERGAAGEERAANVVSAVDPAQPKTTVAEAFDKALEARRDVLGRPAKEDKNLFG